MAHDLNLAHDLDQPCAIFFASGVAIGGLVVAAFTQLIEAAPASHRAATTLWCMLSASLAVALLAPLAFP